MDKDTLDWIFAKGPLIFAILLSIAMKLSKFDKDFVTRKDELGTPITVYLGKSKKVLIMFRIYQFMIVSAFLCVVIYSLYFRGWVGK